LQGMLEHTICQQNLASNSCIVKSRNLERAVALLTGLSGVSQVRFSFSADGVAQGQTQVVVTVEGSAYSVSASALMDNAGIESTGVVRGGLSLQAANLLNSGDMLTANVLGAEKEQAVGRLDWIVPIGSSGLKSAFRASRAEFSVPMGVTGALKGAATSGSVGLMYPMDLHFDNVAVVGLDIGSMQSDGRLGSGTALINRELSYAEVVMAGNSGVRSQAYGSRKWEWVVSLKHGSVADFAAGASAQDLAGAKELGEFDKFTIALTGRQNIGASGWSVGANLRGQTASRNLDASQAMAFGGPNGVRGYRADEGAFDEGWIGTVDISRSITFDSGLKLTPSIFFDHASGQLNHNTWVGWNTGNSTMSNYRALSAYGIGLEIEQGKVQGSLSVAQAMPGSSVSVVDKSKNPVYLWANVQWRFY
jgi:hemolysin activation/secretion protein